MYSSDEMRCALIRLTRTVLRADLAEEGYPAGDSGDEGWRAVVWLTVSGGRTFGDAYTPSGNPH